MLPRERAGLCPGFGEPSGRRRRCHGGGTSAVHSRHRCCWCCWCWAPAATGAGSCSAAAPSSIRRRAPSSSSATTAGAGPRARSSSPSPSPATAWTGAGVGAGRHRYAALTGDVRPRARLARTHGPHGPARVASTHGVTQPRGRRGRLRGRIAPPGRRHVPRPPERRPPLGPGFRASTRLAPTCSAQRRPPGARHPLPRHSDREPVAGHRAVRTRLRNARGRRAPPAFTVDRDHHDPGPSPPADACLGSAPRDAP